MNTQKKLKVITPTNGGRIPCNEVCRIMKSAGVPDSIKWRSLINFLRTIDDNKRFSTQQKRELHAILQEIVHNKSYSDHDYDLIMKRIDSVQFADANIIRWYTAEFAELQAKYKELKYLMNSVLQAYTTTANNGLTHSKERVSDVTTLKETTVNSITQDIDKSLIIANVIQSTEKIMNKINQEIASWNSKFEEVSKWKQVAMDMEKLATVDALTHLFNRRAFDNHLSKMLSAITFASTPLSLMLIDIDNFKKINDTYGHTTGDEVLKLVASIIKKSANSDNYFIARYGGEEFAIICENMDIENTYLLAENIRKNISAYQFKIRYTTNPYEFINFTASIGISEIFSCNLMPPLSYSKILPHDDILRYSLMLIESADTALYTAKKTGKNMTCISLDCLKSSSPDSPQKKNSLISQEAPFH